jgi:hypothetical protein
MEDSNILVGITALICMYLSYIILVRMTVYLIPALNFYGLVFTGCFTNFIIQSLWVLNVSGF